jgi:hypothetical protein
MIKEAKWSIVTSNRREREPRLTIQTNGYIRLNKYLVQKYNLTEFKYARILQKPFDGSVFVAFDLFKENSENAVKLALDERSKCIFLYARNLFRDLSIKPSQFQKKKYSPEMQEVEGKNMLVVELIIRK